jgi:predicted transcriptional regulator YdeE
MSRTEPRIVERNAFQIVGIPLFGNPLEYEFSKAWDLFGQIADETPWMRQQHTLFGLQVYPPRYPEPFEFTYLAGVQIAAGAETPIRCVRKELPASEYAVFEVNGGIKGIDDAYQRAYKDWLPSSEYVLAFPFDFEQYEGLANSESDPSEITVWIPIKARKK